MSLRNVISVLKELRRNPDDRVVIDDRDSSHESSLLGTKDGFMNLAIALLETLEACTESSTNCVIREAEMSAWWSDRIRSSQHLLPCIHPFIVGTYVFDDRLAFGEYLEQWLSSALPPGLSLRNDPALHTLFE